MSEAPARRRTIRLRTVMLLVALVALGVTVVVQSIKVARLEARLAQKDLEVQLNLYRAEVARIHELQVANGLMIERTRSAQSGDQDPPPDQRP